MTWVPRRSRARSNRLVEPAAPTYGHVFVVTYGRSGSTLVQGLLNALPGTLVRGENNFVLRGLFLSRRALARTRTLWAESSGRKGSTSAFFGAEQLDIAAWDSGVRELFDRQLLGEVSATDVRWLGFKEVRWYEITESETKAFLRFMDALYPQARYVLHRRNHADTLKSGYWNQTSTATAWASSAHEMGEEAISRVEAFQDVLSLGREDRVCWTTYEELVDPEPGPSQAALVRLIELLGYPPTAELRSRLTETLKIGHGPKPSVGDRPVPAAGPS